MGRIEIVNTGDYRVYIKKQLGYRELLEQLVEEAAELSQAALKVIRAAGMSNNKTPVCESEAYINLQSEFNDVLLSAEMLNLRRNGIMIADKRQRWAERLGMMHEQL